MQQNAYEIKVFSDQSVIWNSKKIASDQSELGGDKIRVNIVNPDAVISDSNIWAGGWAEGRAKAYGIKVEELPAFYAKGLC